MLSTAGHMMTTSTGQPRRPSQLSQLGLPSPIGSPNRAAEARPTPMRAKALSQDGSGSGNSMHHVVNVDSRGLYFRSHRSLVHYRDPDEAAGQEHVPRPLL